MESPIFTKEMMLSRFGKLPELDTTAESLWAKVSAVLRPRLVDCPTP